MSEFLAEAQVLIRPDTTRFRAELEAALAAATKTPVTVPVVAATTGVTGAAAASKQAAGALAVQENAARKTSAATADLARIQTLTARSAADLAASELKVATASTEAGAAQLRAAAAVRAAARQEEILAAALASGNVALIRAASTTTLLTRAREQEALAALTAARAETAHASTLAAVNKAAVASSASVLGLRGAVLTAGTAFLAATVGFEAGKKTIEAASDTLEEMNKTVEVFAGSAQEIIAWSNTTARGIGIARVEALRAIGTFGELFRTLGVGPARAADLSRTLVQLSADLASFFNADPSRVLQALQSGLVGQARPLRQFGIFLTEARVKQEALIETGKKNVESLTQQERILARYTLILRDAAIASGDFERTQGGLANQTRILKAELSDLAADTGGALVPAVLLAEKGTLEWVQAMRDAVTVMKVTAGGVKDLISSLSPLEKASNKAGFSIEGLGLKISKTYFRTVLLGPALTAASLAVDKLGLSADRAAPKLDAVSAAIQDASDRANAFTPPEHQEFGVQQILNQITGFDAAKVRAQIRGDNEELLSILQQEQAFLESQLSRAGVQRRAGLKRKLEQALLGVVQDIASIQKKGADQAKTVAQDAVRAQREADQALLDLLSTRREDVERAGERAQAEGNLAKAIRAEERFQALVKQQILKIRDQIKDQQARKAAIRQLRIAIQDSRQEEADLRAQRRQEAADRRREFLSLDIQIAQATGNVRREVQARNAEIAFLKQQIRQTRKNSLERKRLILELRQAQKELRELQAEKQKTSDISKQVFFDFLQKQQGFATNLLGNLIPGFATAGLVGGQQAGLQQAVTPPSRALSEAAAVTQVQGRGLTQGQGDTQIAVLRQIRDALFQLTGRTAVPEARYQRATQSAFMDVIGT